MCNHEVWPACAPLAFLNNVKYGLTKKRTHTHTLSDGCPGWMGGGEKHVRHTDTRRCTVRWRWSYSPLGRGEGGWWEGGRLSSWVASWLRGWSWVSEWEREAESRPPKRQSEKPVCVFAADPYTLAQHFLNLSSVFSGHKWISSTTTTNASTPKHTHTDTHTHTHTDTTPSLT